MNIKDIIRIIGFVLISLTLELTVFSQSLTSVNVYKLDNGLTVYLNEDHSKPEIFGLVVTKAGGKNDPSDATGLAHYQEHMLFKGTDELGTSDWLKEKPHIDKIFELYDSLGNTKDEIERGKIQKRINEESLIANEYVIPNDFSNLIKSIGGKDLNANTSEDRTVYFNSFPPNQIEKWLEIYSHRFLNPVFRSFQSELEVVYEEKNLYNDNFFIPLLELFQKNFFKKHPYGQQTVIGTIDHLKNPSLTKMYNFFKTYYVANNMALVLSGDFNSNEVIPLIKEKFGKLTNGIVPQFKEYFENDFNGRELVEVKASPVKLEIMGYRTVKKGNSEELAVEICNSILSNQDQTGLLDKLTLNHKLLAAQVFSYPYHDFGMDIVFVVPKIVGQSLDEAEKLVTNEIDSLTSGRFSDSLFESIKKQKYKQYQLEMENSEYLAILLAEAFSQNRSLQDMIDYPARIKAITKGDVVRTAKKYFGKNFLVLQSKIGFPKKVKLEKPDYKPLLPKANVKSKFADRLDNLNTKSPVEKFVDFEKDIQSADLNGNNKFYYTLNPYNDIFTLLIRFGVGDHKIPLLKYAGSLMNYAGTEKHSLSQLRSLFSSIGCSYKIYSDNSYLYLELEGIESELTNSIKLINELVAKPLVSQDKLDVIIDGEKANRKIETSEPDNVAQALFEYIKYNEKSEFLDRLTIKQIKKLKTDSLVSEFLKATHYQAEIFYTGKKPYNETYNIINSNLKLTERPINTESPVVLDLQNYKENKIFLINKPKALQSKVYFYSDAAPYNIQDEAAIDAFNLYFSGDFSGLVLQEIREYRSLAYSAGARYSVPGLKGKNCLFYGYVGTQSDKTNEAIDVFMGLIRNMPEKTERMKMIKDYLIQVSLTSRPDFRNLAKIITGWKLKGYTEDPAKYKINLYRSFTFADITKFYKSNIQAKPVTIAIVGDKKRIDLKQLEKFGKIIELKEKDVFTK